MDNVDFHQWFINFLIKNLLAEQLKVKLFPINNYQNKKIILTNYSKT